MILTLHYFLQVVGDTLHYFLQVVGDTLHYFLQVDKISF